MAKNEQNIQEKIWTAQVTAGLQTREMHLARIEKLRLMDDDFFSEALDGKTEAVGYILRTVLNRDDLKVVETKAQVEYKSATKRSIRLDVKAVNEDQEHFDIEIQRADSGTGAKRARFHGSMIDRELLEKSMDFEELPESFVIFITENDKYKQGVPLYHIERKIEEDDNALFGDGLHILYVNGEYRDVDTPVGRLMHDFYCTKAEDMYSKELAEEVKYLKETEGGREHMCKILEEMCEEVAEQVAEQVEKETAERVERETTERVKRETAERVEKETQKRVAKETVKSLLALGKLSHEDISASTGLSLEEIEELAAQKTA